MGLPSTLMKIAVNTAWLISKLGISFAKVSGYTLKGAWALFRLFGKK